MGYASECVSVKCIGWAEDQGRRDEMEDSFVFVDAFGGRSSSAFVSLFDGHGGRQAVDFLATELHTAVLAELRRTPSVHEALLRAYTGST